MYLFLLVRFLKVIIVLFYNKKAKKMANISVLILQKSREKQYIQRHLWVKEEKSCLTFDFFSNY